jgi:hypothetical protein
LLNVLRTIEAALQTAFEHSDALGDAGVEPLDLVRQIEREIERNRRVFINDQTYVAHRLTIHLYAPNRARIEEYEALFNNAEFRRYLEEYITERGYKLLDQIRVGIQCHQEHLPEFGKRGCFVEFSWPQVGQDPGEVTVLLDPASDGRILSVNAPQCEMGKAAWLEVLEGTAYQNRVRISRREFNIGRTENVMQTNSGRLLRVNHLAFSRPGPNDVVNRSVSRQHARIAFRESGFYLYDTGSQNATVIERGGSTLFVAKSGRLADGVELCDGDVLAFGQARVRFHLGAMPAGCETDRHE